MSEEFLKALKVAEALEKSRAETYQAYLQKLQIFAAGKKVMRFLVNAEQKHLEFLKKQEKHVKEEEKINLKELKIRIPTIDVEKEETKKMLEGMEGDMNILRAATELEIKDVKFYHEQLEKSKTAEAKELFKKMERLEKEHVELIKKTIQEAVGGYEERAKWISEMQEEGVG